MNLIAVIAGGSLVLIGLLALALAIGVDIGRRQVNRTSPRRSRREVRRWKQAYLAAQPGGPSCSARTAAAPPHPPTRSARQ